MTIRTSDRRGTSDMTMHRILAIAAAMALLVGSVAANAGAPAADNDLDAFMRQVLARRDENWKKLQQYVLDERERFELRGPGRVPLWGERREYTWYIRDGFFVRSPLKVNGVAISDAERRKFEADYLKRQQEREKQGQRGAIIVSNSGISVETPEQGPPPPDEGTRAEIDGILKQTRQPQFISSAYFLRFRFDEGKYALVGHETLDGRDVLRIEYYPTKLFGGTDRRRTGKEPSASARARDAEFQRLMNKGSLITLWVEPTAHQIVKYTFDNVAFDFLPAKWLVHINDLKIAMTMGQPFPDVWLPRDIDLAVSMTMVMGQIDVRYNVDYYDYRQPDVKSKVGLPKER